MRVLLCCAGGLSSSILMKKMQTWLGLCTGGTTGQLPYGRYEERNSNSYGSSTFPGLCGGQRRECHEAGA